MPDENNNNENLQQPEASSDFGAEREQAFQPTDQTEYQPQVQHYNDQDPPAADQATPDMEPESTVAQPTPIDQQQQAQFANTTPAPVQPTDQPAQSAFEQPKSRKPIFIIGGLVALVVLLIGSSMAAYALWYQSPDKVIADSIVNALKSDTVKATSTVSIVTKEMSVKLAPEFNNNDTKTSVKTSVTVEANDEKYAMLDGVKLEFEAIVEKSGDTYVKFSKLQTLYDKAVDAYMQQLEENYKIYGGDLSPADKAKLRSQMDLYVKPIIEKVDDQWIKSTVDESSETSKKQKCYAEAFETLKKDDNLKELGEVYEGNKFVIYQAIARFKRR